MIVDHEAESGEIVAVEVPDAGGVTASCESEFASEKLMLPFDHPVIGWIVE